MAQTKEKKRAWYMKNCERIKAKRRERYRAAPEKEMASHREWSSRNKEHIKKYDREKYLAGQEKWREVGLKYYYSNIDACKKRNREWMRNNPAKVNFRNATRRALQINATPRWVDSNAIKKIYEQAASISRATGIEHHVDHIYPLNGVGFVGLHVPWNLQILTAEENIRKGNRLCQR